MRPHRREGTGLRRIRRTRPNGVDMPTRCWYPLHHEKEQGAQRNGVSRGRADRRLRSLPRQQLCQGRPGIGVLGLAGQAARAVLRGYAGRRARRRAAGGGRGAGPRTYFFVAEICFAVPMPIGIDFGLASSLFGSSTVRMPSTRPAEIFSGSTFAGSEKARTNRP